MKRANMRIGPTIIGKGKGLVKYKSLLVDQNPLTYAGCIDSYNVNPDRNRI